jgi:hypothetical protein
MANEHGVGRALGVFAIAVSLAVLVPGVGCREPTEVTLVLSTDTRCGDLRDVAHAASALPTGRVLIAGGYTGALVTNTAEFFNPLGQ